MPEAHDPLAPFQPGADLLVHAVVAADRLQQLHHLLVGAAVQRPLERADRAGDGGVHVRQGGGDHAGGEGGRVHLVVGVQDQGNVERLCGGRAGLLTGQHVQEVGRMRRAPGSGAIGSSPRRRRSYRATIVGIFAIRRVALAKLASTAFEFLSGSSNESDDTRGAQHLHRLGVIGQHVDHRGGLRRQLASVGQGRGERLQLGHGGQMPAQSQEAHLFVGGVLREVADVVPAVDQNAVLTVDRAQAAARNHHTFESTFVCHARPSAVSLSALATSTQS